MLMIRLQRTGRKHEPTFRLVLTDSKNGPKSGKYLKNLGWYDTRIKNTTDQFDVEQIKHWMSHGAKLSVTVHNFLISKKVIEGKKLNALSRKSPIKKEVAKEEKKAEEKAGEVKGEEKKETKEAKKEEVKTPVAKVA
ncbi:MAG: 30S ribosomal protein S16 [Candidatus Taylorbacteria bacterium]|nr:30S ribosomal protein S16 [Candidatus Taylorbacteria bacterium]